MIHGNALEEQNAIENVFTGNRSTEKEYKTQNALTLNTWLSVNPRVFLTCEPKHGSLTHARCNWILQILLLEVGEIFIVTVAVEVVHVGLVSTHPRHHGGHVHSSRASHAAHTSPKPPMFFIISSRSPPPAPPSPSASLSSSSFHLPKSTLSQCCLVFSARSLSQYGPSSAFSRANSMHLGLTWYLVASGSTSFRNFMFSSKAALSAPPLPLKNRESFSTLISGFSTSDTLIVRKMIFGL